MLDSKPMQGSTRKVKDQEKDKIMADEASEERKQVERQVEKIEEAVKEIKRLEQDRDLTDASRPPGKPTTPPPTRRPKEED